MIMMWMSMQLSVSTIILNVILQLLVIYRLEHCTQTHFVKHSKSLFICTIAFYFTYTFFQLVGSHIYIPYKRDRLPKLTRTTCKRLNTQRYKVSKAAISHLDRVVNESIKSLELLVLFYFGHMSSLSSLANSITYPNFVHFLVEQVLTCSQAT